MATAVGLAQVKPQQLAREPEEAQQVVETRRAGAISVRRSAVRGYSTAETNEETASQIPHHSASEVSREMLQAAPGLRRELLRCSRCCDTRA